MFPAAQLPKRYFTEMGGGGAHTCNMSLRTLPYTCKNMSLKINPVKDTEDIQTYTWLVEYKGIIFVSSPTITKALPSFIILRGMGDTRVIPYWIIRGIIPNQCIHRHHQAATQMARAGNQVMNFSAWNTLYMCTQHAPVLGTIPYDLGVHKYTQNKWEPSVP